MKKLRLGCVYQDHLGFDGCKYYYRTGEWQFIIQLARLFDEVDICCPVIYLSQEEIQKRGFTYVMDTHTRMIVHPLTTTHGVSWFSLKWFVFQLSILVKLRHLAKLWDLAFIIVPGWPALICWLVQFIEHFPHASFIGGNWAEIAKNNLASRPKLFNLLLPPYLYFIERVEKQLVYRSKFRWLASLDMINRYPNLEGPTFIDGGLTIQLHQFSQRSDTCQKSLIKLSYVGGLNKGLDITIQALALLVQRGYNLELHIAGDGAKRKELEQLCMDFNLENRVVFHGFVPNGTPVLEFLSTSDIFVMHSYTEGFPRVIYEAMSQSTPVIATRVGGIPYTLVDGQHALLVEPGNIQEIANAIERIMNDQKLRQHMIQEGYKLTYEYIQADFLGQAMNVFKEEVQSLRGQK